MVGVEEFRCDQVGYLSLERVMKGGAVRFSPLRKVLAVEYKVASAAGSVSRDVREFRMLSQKLVDALSFVLLGVQVDHNDLPRRGESDVVESAGAEVMREVAVSRVVFPPFSDRRLLSGIGFVGPRAVYGINLPVELIAIEPERLGRRKVIKRRRNKTRHIHS